MDAREYFALLDAIAGTRTDGDVSELRARLAATAMHPFERTALERRLRRRERALWVEADRGRAPARPNEEGPRP